MRALARHRTLVRRTAAWLSLVAIGALVLLPAIAFAAENLVTSSSVPSDWFVVFNDAELYHVTGSYAHLGTVDTEYGPTIDAVWQGETRLFVTLMGGSTMFNEFEFSSWEDFQARAADSYSADVPYSWGGAQRTSIGGYEAYLIVGDYTGPAPGDPDSERYDRAWVAWVPLAEGGISISANAWAEGSDAAAGFEQAAGDVTSALGSLRFRTLEGAGAGAPGLPALPGDEDPSPWRTVTGGIAAVAAAAVALAGAAASARAKTGAEEPAPDQPVGYVLQLSTRSLTVGAEHAANLTVQAFAVLPDASYRPAADAAIVLHPPAGVSVQPQTAYGTLQTSVWATGAVAPGAAITVEARASLGTTTTAVAVAAAGESRIVTRIEPAGTLALRTQGEHTITLVAAVELLGPDATDATLDPAAIRTTIEFAGDSEWLDVSEPADYDDGRAISVMASQPDPTSPVQPPESATVRVSAWLGERPLTELVAIPLARLPEIDAKPDHVALAAESGSVVEVAVTITNAGDAPWQFDTEWREGSPVIASADITPTGPAAATLTLTESGAEGLDPTRPETASTLVVIATADGFDELRRHVDVIVTQEGLFIDRTNVDPSTGAFPLAADGSRTPTRIDLRVFVRDPASGEIAPDVGLAEQATLEVGGQEGTSGYAGLQAAGLEVSSAGVRQLNVPSAMFDISLERRLPTAGEPVPAAVLASVPGHDAERFSALVPLRLLGVDMEPYSEAWEVERDNCLDIIRGFVPFEHQDRLYALVSERSLTMGAEGLFYLRKQIWSFAYDQLMKEKHEHLDAAWWYEKIEDTLEWVSWCGDIALGVVSGTAVGVVGSIALGMLKPLLVSAMEVWLAGGSLEDWLLAQTSTLTGVLEGSLTDPDFLTTLSGEKKAIGWALFIAYYFAKELYNDPQLSVTNAAKNVARQLRDEGLVRFLQMIAGMKGITPKAPDGDAGAPKTANADAAPAKTAADAGAPDAAATRTTPDAASPDAAPAKTAADAGAPDAAASKPTTPDTDAAGTRPQAEAPTSRPETDAATTTKTDADAAAAKAAEGDATPDQTPSANGDAGPAPEQKPGDSASEKAPEKAPEQVAEKTPEPPADTSDRPDPRRTSGDPATRADGMADDIAARTRDGKPLDLETAERIMRDPDAMRKLRKDHPEAWAELHKTRERIYGSHDERLKSWIAENVPGAEGKTIEIESFGTKDGVDRDYRAGYVTVDPASGKRTFIEIPKERWAAESQRIFAEETGGPTDPAGAAEWSKDHQQLATDQYHAEASVDMADQGKVWNPEGGPIGPDGKPTGAWEQTQLTPNVELVKQGTSTLLDPDGLGKTYETKVAEAYHEGNVLDAYKQADKAVHSLEGCREGYAKQHYGVKDLPPKVAAGMDVIKDVQSGDLTPADAEARLKEMGYHGGLPDFMERVSGQFAAFKWARKP